MAATGDARPSVGGNAKPRTVGEGNRPIPYRSLDQMVADGPSLMGYALVVYTPATRMANQCNGRFMRLIRR